MGVQMDDAWDELDDWFDCHVWKIPSDLVKCPECGGDLALQGSGVEPGSSELSFTVGCFQVWYEEADQSRGTAMWDLHEWDGDLWAPVDHLAIVAVKMALMSSMEVVSLV